MYEFYTKMVVPAEDSASVKLQRFHVPVRDLSIWIKRSGGGASDLSYNVTVDGAAVDPAELSDPDGKELEQSAGPTVVLSGAFPPSTGRGTDYPPYDIELTITNAGKAPAQVFVAALGLYPPLSR